MDTTTVQVKLSTATDQLKHLKKDISKAKQHLKTLEKEYADTQKVVNELNQQIPAMYYPHLEATKVIQVILDQPGMFHVGRLVCKKWNEYLISKVRPNLILSPLIRGVVGSKNDPYPLFSKEVSERSSFYLPSVYYAKILQSNGDKRDLEEIKKELKTLPDDLKLKWKKMHAVAASEFRQQKELYYKFTRRNIPKLGVANKKFYDFLITNMLDHPIGPPLYDLYKECQILFAEPIGSMWHVIEHILPFAKELDVFYGKLQCYLPVMDVFPGYKPKPATPGPASPGPKKAYPKKVLKKATPKRRPTLSSSEEDELSYDSDCVSASCNSDSDEPY